jgi:hypothetical protein
VRALAEAERCVGELAVAVGLSQSCTTRHLQALERLGLVEGRREGKRVCFRLRGEAPGVGELLGWALTWTTAYLPVAVVTPGLDQPGMGGGKPGAEAPGVELGRRRRGIVPGPIKGTNATEVAPGSSCVQVHEESAEDRSGVVGQRPGTSVRPGDLEDYLL